MVDETKVYDAIVVGSGMSGGWAAKEFCENGHETLVLERGRDVKHIEDYPTKDLDSWDTDYNGMLTQEQLKRQEKQMRTAYLANEYVNKWFVDDIDHPYNEIKRFDWTRGYHVGGRSIMWGRQVYRWSDIDFEANKKEGIAVDWPIRYADLAPWYSKVERFIGVSGEKLGLDILPDSEFLDPMDLVCVEQELKEKMASQYDDGRLLTIGRVAHITSNHDQFEDRIGCQYRNRCARGCQFGGYFSANASTLPAAHKTGKMTLRPHSIVKEIVYDEDSGLATGVMVIDAETKEEILYKARTIFLCASTVGSTSILMQSKSDRFKEGMGNDSGELGHNMMDHHFQVGAGGISNEFQDKYYTGRRPNGIYIPRFRNLGGKTEVASFKRGYGYQGGGNRGDAAHMIKEEEMFGDTLKNAVTKPGRWNMRLGAFGEILPYHDNKMTLDYAKKDQWGLPTVSFDCELKENELRMREDMESQAVEMLTKAGFENVRGYQGNYGFGNGIHEMGTARMGRDPKTSVLDENNAVHAVKNVYVTDGSCMTSANCVNPSLTYMALTARAANHASEQLKQDKFDYYG